MPFELSEIRIEGESDISLSFDQKLGQYLYLFWVRRFVEGDESVKFVRDSIDELAVTLGFQTNWD